MVNLVVAIRLISTSPRFDSGLVHLNFFLPFSEAGRELEQLHFVLLFLTNGLEFRLSLTVRGTARSSGTSAPGAECLASWPRLWQDGLLARLLASLL